MYVGIWKKRKIYRKGKAELNARVVLEGVVFNLKIGVNMYVEFFQEFVNWIINVEI